MRDALRRALPFDTLTEEQIATFEEEGEELFLRDGDTLMEEGEPASGLCVLLEGALTVTKRIGGREVLLTNQYPGAFVGEISLLTGQPHLATVKAIADCHLVRYPPALFKEGLDAAPLLRALMSTMAQRLRSTEAMVQQHEKLSALGKLAAGLAHEMNNPASASVRAAKQLRETLAALQDLSLRLGRLGLSDDQIALVQGLRETLAGRSARAALLDPLARADREDALTGWLESRSVGGAWRLAPVLAQAGAEIADLEALRDWLGDAALETALDWLASALAAAELSHTIEQSTARISALVMAIKAYTYMDRSHKQEVDVREGLENTLTILKHKLVNVTVTRDYAPDLPRITAHGSQLNQVWTNLIDNAIDAMGGAGQICIRAAREYDRVVVEITDDGPGIPADVQPRIFEPFFTTKDVGDGTGMGLDIVYRIVAHEHRGDIQLFSEPGETRFKVCLPIQGEGE